MSGYSPAGAMYAGEVLPLPRRRTERPPYWPTPVAVAIEPQNMGLFVARKRRLRDRHHNGNGGGLPLSVTVHLGRPPAGGNAFEWFCGELTALGRLVGVLNPAWVEHLMGFPPDWTAIA